MDRRGQLEFAAILIILLTSVGAAVVISESKHIYVGDKNLNMFYDYKLCPDEVKGIKEGNQIVFSSEAQAKSSGYNPIRGCVNGEK